MAAAVDWVMARFAGGKEPLPLIGEQKQRQKIRSIVTPD